MGRADNGIGCHYRNGSPDSLVACRRGGASLREVLKGGDGRWNACRLIDAGQPPLMMRLLFGVCATL